MVTFHILRNTHVTIATLEIAKANRRALIKLLFINIYVANFLTGCMLNFRQFFQVSNILWPVQQEDGWDKRWQKNH